MPLAERVVDVTEAVNLRECLNMTYHDILKGLSMYDNCPSSNNHFSFASVLHEVLNIYPGSIPIKDGFLQPLDRPSIE